MFIWDAREGGVHHKYPEGAGFTGRGAFACQAGYFETLALQAAQKHDVPIEFVDTDAFPLPNGARAGGLNRSDPAHMALLTTRMNALIANGTSSFRVISRTVTYAVLDAAKGQQVCGVCVGGGGGGRGSGLGAHFPT
jgi:hypothetical protein